MTAAEIVKALGGKNGRCNCPVERHKPPLSLAISDGNASLGRVTHKQAQRTQDNAMSALPPKSDIGVETTSFRYGPQADYSGF